MYYIYYLDWETGNNLEAWVPIPDFKDWLKAINPVVIYEKKVA